MGRSVITIVVTGNHGCDRLAREGDPLANHVARCNQASCVDCLALGAVKALEAAGNNVESATHVHWPEGAAIQDDLLAGKRSHGNF